MPLKTAKIFRDRIEKIDSWLEREEALDKEKEDTRRSWHSTDKRILKDIEAALRGWSKPARNKLLFRLGVKNVLAYGHSCVYLEPRDYHFAGFDGSPDSCRVWRNCADTQRDMEPVVQVLSTWFVVETEPRRIVVNERGKKEVCLMVRLSLATG